MTSLTTLRTELDQDVTRDISHRIRSSATKDRALNDAQVQVCIDLWLELEECRDAESISSVAGTMEYSLPSDFLRVVEVRYDGTPLMRVTKPQLKQRFRSFSNSGTPTRYYVYWSYLWVYPLPSASGVTIDLEYLKKLPTLTDSQGTVVPDTYNRAIKYYAAHLLWLPMNFQKSEEFIQEYDKQIEKLRSWYIHNDDNLVFSYERYSSNVFSDKAL